MLTIDADGVSVDQVYLQPQQHSENVEGLAYWQIQEARHCVIQTAKIDHK